MTPWLSSTLQQLSWTAQIALAAWLLIMVTMPLQRWMGGRPTETHGIVAGVVLQARRPRSSRSSCLSGAYPGR